MATLIPCPTCKKKISVTAESCPQCGHVLTDEECDKAIKDAKNGRIGCLVLFVVLIGVGFFMEIGKEDDKPAPIAQLQQTEQSGAPKATPAAVKNPELPWTKEMIVVNYNGAAAVLKLPRVDVQSGKHTQDVAQAWNYTLSPYTSMVIIGNLGSNRATSVMFIGAGDGTKESGPVIILSAVCMVTALTPDATGDQRGSLFKKLGLIDGSVTDGKDRKVTFGSVKFSASFNTTTGLMVMASPQ